MALTVLQVLPALDEGGVERGTLEIARHLVSQGERSLVVSAGGRLVEQLESEGSRHLTASVGSKNPFTFRWVPWLRRLFEEHGIDIVHVRSRLPAWMVFLAWRGIPVSMRPRLVTTVHGLYSVNPYSAIMTRGERVIAVSETVKRYILENYPRIRPEDVRLIFRGVDPQQFYRGFQPAPDWTGTWFRDYPELLGKFVVTLCGRLSRIKGHEDFLHIIARLARAGLPVHGLVVGEHRRKSDYVKALKNTVAANTLPITFCGHRDDITEVYASSSLVVSLTARPESFGRSVLEPLSLGVPVIGYDHGGVGEILEKMFPFGRVRPGDVVTVAEKTQRLIEQPLEVAEQNPFPLKVMQENTIALYRELQRVRTES